MSAAAVVHDSSKLGSEDKASVFWVPMLFQTSNKAEEIINEMLDLITTFQDNAPPQARNSFILQGPRRRQQILGEVEDSVAKTTTVDVVMKSENTRYLILSVLKRHFLFSQMHNYEIEDVIDSMTDKYVEDGEIIIQQGEEGYCFYVLEEGTCEVIINDEIVSEINEGHSFGDLALMYNCPRSATVKAISDCTLWCLDRVFFRQAMVTSSSNQSTQQTHFLSRISLFETLSIESLNQLARSLTKQTFDDGHYIIRQGEIGEQFYVIIKGKVRVTKTGDTGDEVELIRLGEGDVFGERALIKKEPRAANVIADGPVECYFLNKHDFALILGSIVEKLNDMNQFRVLRSTSIFQGLSDYRLKLLSKEMDKCSSFSGQRLICDSAHLIVVMDGQLESSTASHIFKPGSVIGDLDVGADVIAGSLTTISDESLVYIFSRQALLDHFRAQSNDPVNAGVEEAKPASTRGSTLRGSTRNSILSTSVSGPIGDSVGEKSMKELITLRKVTAMARSEGIVDYKCDNIEDLEMISALGKGTFGNVYLARNKRSGKYLALKTLDKSSIATPGQFHYVKREVLALQSFHHPFIGEYYGILLTKRKIFLLLEFLPGQDLWNYLYHTTPKHHGPYGSLEIHTAALYAATVIQAIEHIHGRGYAYRDLKPENLLFAANGYIKLVDFGFAKPLPFLSKTNTVQHRTFTLCGTPDYMAPEVVLTQGHDKSADFWTFGILLYEMLCGHTPFEGKTQQRTFEKIVHSQKFLSFPPRFDPHCKSLIRRLLHPNAGLRLGALEHGFNDIKAHAFFLVHGINMSQIANQEVAMPYIPATHSEEELRDASNTHVPMIDLVEEANAINFEGDDAIDEEKEAKFRTLLEEEDAGTQS